MAWNLQTGLSGWGLAYFEVEPPCRELEASWEYKKARGYSPAPLAHQSVEIEDRFWPRRATLKSRRRELPALVGFCSFYGVSDSFRQVIEALEPGLHEFRKVDLFRPNGDAYPAAYYALNVRRRLDDLVDWEVTTAHSSVIGERKFVSSGFGSPGPLRVAMRRTALVGKHLWRSDELLSGLTCSNEAHVGLAERGLLRGLSVTDIDEV